MRPRFDLNRAQCSAVFNFVIMTVVNYELGCET